MKARWLITSFSVYYSHVDIDYHFIGDERMKLPPLVEPSETLTNEEIKRYSRHLLIPAIGIEGQCRLKSSCVLVIGAGGLGSPVLLYLAAAGVGCIGIVDFDRVDDSNLQRQIIHNTATIDWLKAESAKATLEGINPYITVNIYTSALESKIAVDLFSKYDLIIDCTDNFSTRYLINDACMLAEKPYVWGAVFSLEGQASVFWENAPGNRGINYRDLYPEPPPVDLFPSCAEGGVLGIICASIGSIMATEAIKLLTGIGNSLIGRLIIFDAMEMTYKEMPLRKSPQHKTITALSEYNDLYNPLPITEEETGNSGLWTITPQELQDLLETPAVIIDVREKTEWDIVHIPTAIHMPKRHDLASQIKSRFENNESVIIYCKNGFRSQLLQAELQQLGMSQVRQLKGGIIQWVNEIDPSLPVY